MAAADTALVISDQLQRPNSVLNAAHPAAGLPRLQSAVFGTAVMGYGDLFVAGALGGLLALNFRRGEQLRGAALTAAFALCFDLLFLVVNELPATVPVAVALVALAGIRRRARLRALKMSRDVDAQDLEAGREEEEQRRSPAARVSPSSPA